MSTPTLANTMPCSMCDGTGRIGVHDSDDNDPGAGVDMESRPCRGCHGTGRVGYEVPLEYEGLTRDDMTHEEWLELGPGPVQGEVVSAEVDFAVVARRRSPDDPHPFPGPRRLGALHAH